MRGRDKRPNQGRFYHPKSSDEALERLKLRPAFEFVLHVFAPPKPTEELAMFEPMTIAPSFLPMTDQPAEKKKVEIGRKPIAGKRFSAARDSPKLRVLLRRR